MSKEMTNKKFWFIIGLLSLLAIILARMIV